MGVTLPIPSGVTHIVASDEVGYGALAGPLCIGVVCVPVTWKPLVGLTDSKKLSWDELTRLTEEFYTYGRATPDVGGTVHTYDVEMIDRMGVGKLLPWAHESGISDMVAFCRRLGGTPFAIVDGNMKIAGAFSLPKADLLVPACSMASVIAKVHHDKLMEAFDQQYPGYDFANSVGYNSPEHIAGLERMGPCAIHRRSYSSYDKYKKPEEPLNMWEFEGD